MALFVSGWKYESLRNDLLAEKVHHAKLQYRFEQKVLEWNTLVNRINAKGGEAFLNSEQQFTQDELKTLIQLCHPDKHDGKESAVRITQRLLELKNGS